MKQYVVSLLFLTSSFSAAASHDVVGWQEFPRTTMTEKCVAAVMQSLSASIGLHFFTDSPTWVHALTPSIGLCALGPSVVVGLRFKKKIEACKVQHVYDPKNLTDPLLYVNAFEHPLNPNILIVSGAGLWKAYTALAPEQQRVFAKKLLKSLDYDSVEWALRSVQEAKRHIEKALQDLKKYSDIEERLNRVLDFQEQKPILRTEHMLGAEPQDLEGFVQQILDSGTYCQEVMIHAITKQVTTQDVAATWYDDDFVYCYASWYGFELLKAYSRLLAFEKIALSLVV